MKAKSKKIMGLFLALVMLLGCLPLNTIETYAAPEDVAIDATNFPDENFRKYVKDNFDKNPADDALSQTEIDAVTKIDVSKKKIKDLKGVEFFKKLTWFNCEGNQLMSLDVSHNTALTTLVCSSNQLTSLDVSHNTALDDLLADNNKITTLNVSKNTALYRLIVDRNKLTTLDVSNNPALKYLNLSFNELTTLDVSNNLALELLDLSINKLTTLDVSNNLALEVLYCSKNELTTLDVSNNPDLKELLVDRNKLTTLDVRNNKALDRLSCYDNQLTTLDVRNNKALDRLSCYDNQLTTLDVRNNTALKNLSCESNKLTTLDVSQNTALTNLDCSHNQLTSLDVSQNTALDGLSCYDNQLTTLKLSSRPITEKLTSQKYTISVPKGTSIMNFPAGFDVNKIQGTVAGLNITSSGIEWDEQASPISFQYLLCDNPEEIVKIDVEVKDAPNPDLDKATQLVKKAETEKTEENYTKAKAAVDALAKGSGKTGLDTRLKELRTLLDELKTAKDAAKTEIGNLPNLSEDEKAPFIKQVDDAKTKGEVDKAVEDAKNADDLKAYKEKAKEEIGNLPNLSEDEKAPFIKKVDDATDKAGVDQAVNDAKAKDKANKELKEAKEKAKDEIGNLPNLSDTEKDEYKGKVDNATDKSGVDQAVNDAKAKDTANKELKEAKEKAKDEIRNLPNLSDAEKDKYKKQVDDAQTKGQVEKAVEDAKAKDAENKAAADEKNKPATDDDKNKAKDEIDKLPNLSDDEKDKYKGDVDNAQTKGDVEKAVEDAKAKDAENKNAADEKNKPATPDDKNAAKDEIDKLPNLSDDEKDKYKKQVDDAQTKGDVAKIVDEAKAKAGVPTPEPSPTPNPSVDRDHDYWYRPYWTYSYGTSNTTKQTPVKTNLVKLESKLVIGSKEMVKSVDGVEQKINMDIAPFIEGNRTMLPIRFVAESLGFNVQWDKESRTVILIDKENVVKIPVDTNQIIVNGKVYESDVKPVIRNNRTMLPIANIARALGLKDGTDIIWNAATKEVKINREIEK